MRIPEENPAPYDEARMERLSALYERCCHSAGSDRADSTDHREDVAAVPCKLAPAVLRRAASAPRP